MSSWISSLTVAPEKTVSVLVVVGILASFDLTRRFEGRKHVHYLLGCVLGTFLSVGFLQGVPLLFSQNVASNPFAVALGVVLLFVLWRLLFGPWDTHVKATVLGMFLFWIALHMIEAKMPQDRLVTVISMTVALVPAALWAWMFLPYHSEKPARIALMFFAGMASTAPILFYDALVDNGSQLHFFYFRVVPESFNAATQSFVNSEFHGAAPLSMTMTSVLLSFLFVAIIEEGSKYWVLRKSGERLFSSIDDALELSIIVALGFAFAENILNSSYFPSFVNQYLLRAESRDLMAFVGNVAGRSILTTMVHVVSTGIVGIALGRAMFARSILHDDLRRPRRTVRFSRLIGNALNIDPVIVFRSLTLSVGFLFGVLSHTAANFIVTLPEILPGHPKTVGEAFGYAPDSFMSGISLILFPSLFYVVGGFLLLTWLLEWQSNRAERKKYLLEEAFVSTR